MPQSAVLSLVWLVLVASVQTSYLPLSLRHGGRLLPRPLPRLPRVFGFTQPSYYHPSLYHPASPSRLLTPGSQPLELASKFHPVPAVPVIRDEAILPDPVLETAPESAEPLPVIKSAPVAVTKPRPEPVFSLQRPASVQEVAPVFSLQRPARPVPASVQEVAGVEARVEPLPAPLSPGSTSSQWHAQDEAGHSEYGYRNVNSAKHEAGLAGHSVRGSYSWVDEAGFHEVHYVADENGFRIVARPGAA